MNNYAGINSIDDLSFGLGPTTNTNFGGNMGGFGANVGMGMGMGNPGMNVNMGMYGNPNMGGNFGMGMNMNMGGFNAGFGMGNNNMMGGMNGNLGNSFATTNGTMGYQQTGVVGQSTGGFSTPFDF